MKLFTLKSSIAIAGLFCSLNLSAHDPIKKTCGNDIILKQYFQENFTPEQLQTLSAPSARSAAPGDYTVPVVNTDSVYTIQVVVHVVYLNDNKYENPSDAIIQSQIDALNRDFNLENDISHIRPEFLPFIGNPKIRFELAKIRPNGDATTGIDRVKSKPTIPAIWDPNPLFDNVKNKALGGVNPWYPQKYLNIWVCDLNMERRLEPNNIELDPEQGALGGYANPPQGLPNWQMEIMGIKQNMAAVTAGKQGVVIDFRFFGQDPEYVKDYLNGSPYYSMGRTTTHEVGHYLGLRHQWGDGAAFKLLFPDFDECSVDDGISDTPNQGEPYANFIEKGNVCGATPNTCDTPNPIDGIDYPDMRENYMDYSTDVCYGMFTKEQVNMMRYALTTKRNDIVIKREVPVPTSVNNLKNLEVSLHPNPVNSHLHLQIQSNVSRESKIDIFNTLGAKVRSIKLDAGTQEAEISVQDFAPGNYMIYIENEGRNFVKQFIKL